MIIKSINSTKKYRGIINSNKIKLNSEIILIFHFNSKAFYMRYFVAGYLPMCDRLCSTSKQIINILTGTCLEGYIAGNENSDHIKHSFCHTMWQTRKK